MRRLLWWAGAQRASNAESVSISWRHLVSSQAAASRWLFFTSSSTARGRTGGTTAAEHHSTWRPNMAGWRTWRLCWTREGESLNWTIRDSHRCTTPPPRMSPVRWPLTHWPLGNLDAILKLQFSISFYWLISSYRLRIMPWDECQGTSTMISHIGSGNGLLPSGNKPLPEPMLTLFHVAIWRHQATKSNKTVKSHEISNYQ